MKAELLTALRMNYRNGLIQCKISLVRHPHQTFESFSEFQCANARFSRCRTGGTTKNMYMFCSECCNNANVIYCVDCFRRGDHADHKAYITTGDYSVCDCGNPTALDRSKWCDVHRNIDLGPEPEPQYVERFACVVSTVLAYASEVVKKNKFTVLLKFLGELCEWGTFYCKVVAKELFDGGWNKSPFGVIVGSWEVMLSENLAVMGDFCFQIVGTDEFVDGYLRHLVKLVETSFIVSASVNAPGKFLSLVSLAWQCPGLGEILVRLEENENILTNVLATVGDNMERLGANAEERSENILRGPRGRCMSMVRVELGAFAILDDVMLMRRTILGPRRGSAFREYARVLRLNDGMPLLWRKVGVRELYDTETHTLGRHRYDNVMTCLVLPVTVHITLIATKDSVRRIGEISAPELVSMTAADKEALVDILNILFSGMKPAVSAIMSRETMFGTSVPVIAPATDTFSVNYCLSDAWMLVVRDFCLIHEIDPRSIIEMTSVDRHSLLGICARGVCVSAANAQVLSGIFALNDSSLYAACYCCTLDFRAVDMVQVMMHCCDKPGDIVAQAAEAFGLTLWKNVAADEALDCTNWTAVMADLLRFFIIIASTPLDVRSVGPHDFCLPVAHVIYAGAKSKKEIMEYAPWMSDVGYKLDAYILQIADSHGDPETGSRFVLKPEIRDSVTVFSVFLRKAQFNAKLSEENENGKGQLLNIVPIEHLGVLPRMHDFLGTDELKIIIYDIIKVSASTETKCSTALTRTALALLRIILKMATDVDLITEKYQDVFRLIISECKKLRFGVHLLRNLRDEVQERFGVFAEMITSAIDADLKEIAKNRRRDRNDILDRFKAARQAFARENQDDLSTLQDACVNQCVICRENCNDDGDAYGLLAAMYRTTILSTSERAIAGDDLWRHPICCSIHVCGHFAHRRCYTGYSCPVDRSAANVILPVCSSSAQVSPSYVDSWMNIEGNIERMTNTRLPQVIAYNISVLELLTRTDSTGLEDRLRQLALLHTVRFIAKVEKTFDRPVEQNGDAFSMFVSEIFAPEKRPFQEILAEFWSKVAESLDHEIDDMSCFDVFMRRVHILHTLVFTNDCASSFPTREEFCTVHGLRSPEAMMLSRSCETTEFMHLLPQVPFMFSGLCEYFTDFYADPSRGSILTNRTAVFVHCLMCGCLCRVPSVKYDPDEQAKNVVELTDHVRFRGYMPYAPVLYLTGDNASAVVMIDVRSNDVQNCGSVYTDGLNDIDVGLRRGSILRLNGHRLRTIITKLLQGSI